MNAILELSSAVRTRRSHMGLTQTALSKLSGLSRATINQLENCTINDLSLTRVAKLLGTLGLSVTVSAPRPKSHPNPNTKSSALDIAARTSSVSYRVAITADQLREFFTSDSMPAAWSPHVYTLLEEAPVSLLASVVEALHAERGVERSQVWARMRALARQLKSSRALWL
jgi:transcriptional regulator with XRE-family HTH domain